MPCGVRTFLEGINLRDYLARTVIVARNRSRS
jgi:hypothetical protein